jgi:guanylate kinase
MSSSATGAAPGTLYVVSAPSGAGKTSLVRALVARDAGVKLSVSHTTRARRPGERDAEHYHFVDAATFARMCDEGAFLEHAQVFGNRYGTSRAAVDGPLRAGLDIVLEIDWQGARQVRNLLPDSVGIFVLPPSLEQLRVRLESRGQDGPEIIQARMRAAVREIAHYQEYDYLVVNDRFDTALDELSAIVTARRLGQNIQRRRLHGLLEGLLAGYPKD